MMPKDKAKTKAAGKGKTPQKTRKPARWLLPLCYLLGALVYLALCLFGLLRQNAWAKDGTLEIKPAMALDEFVLNSILVVERDGETGGSSDKLYPDPFVSTDSDPQMIYAREDGTAFAPGIVTFAATPSRPTGEIVLYYETRPGQGYSDTRRVWATGGEHGAWQFDMSGKKVYSIRLDPDSVAEGVLWQVSDISIGGQKSAPAWFIPGPLACLLLLTLPLLGWAALREGFAAMDFAVGGWLAKRKRKK